MRYLKSAGQELHGFHPVDLPSKAIPDLFDDNSVSYITDASYPKQFLAEVCYDTSADTGLHSVQKRNIRSDGVDMKGADNRQNIDIQRAIDNLFNPK